MPWDEPSPHPTSTPMAWTTSSRAPRLVVNDAYDAGALFVYPGLPEHAGLRPQLDTRDATWWEAAGTTHRRGTLTVATSTTMTVRSYCRPSSSAG